MTKATEPAHAICGRCGYPKAEHVTVKAGVLLCPTALYLKDELAELVNEP